MTPYQPNDRVEVMLNPQSVKDGYAPKWGMATVVLVAGTRIIVDVDAYADYASGIYRVSRNPSLVRAAS